MSLFKNPPPGVDKDGNVVHVLSESEIQEKLNFIRAKEERIALAQGLPFLFGWKWYKWAREFYECKNKIALLTAANQVSKPLNIDCLVPTPSGMIEMRHLSVGDYVFDQNGAQVKVIDIPFIGESEAYEIEFSDGSVVVAGETHDWICKGYRERFRKTYTVGRGKNSGEIFDNESYGKWQVLTTREIIAKGKYKPGTIPTKRFSIPVGAPVELAEKPLFDPYFVGIFLGNGSIHSITFNNADTDMSGYCEKYGNKINCANGKLVISILHETRHLLTRLGIMKPSSQKFIPAQYMLGSIWQRKALLAGLMDTDGTCGRSGQNYSYSTTSKQLAGQVLELVCSLGGMGQIKKYPSYYYKKDSGEKVICKYHYVVTIWTMFNPFRSKRKSARWKLNSRYKHERVITKITPIGKRTMKCITVDNADGSFLCTKDYIVTHNSSTQIRTFINWATDKSLWPDMWNHEPNQFWYLYPTHEQVNVEFETKWKQFLPKNEYVDHPTYGYKVEKRAGEIKSIQFNSGVSIYFKTYSQSVSSLQSGTVYAIGADEELPQELFDELMFRLSATNGYFRMVFTATLGQDFWRKAMEPGPNDEEVLPGAWKKTVSLYDAMFYEDGTASHWTAEKISQVRSRCSTPQEVQKRVYGKFVVLSGRKYQAFDITKHIVKKHPVPQSWYIYGGVDPGSGGEHGHPAAICFVAVRPDYRAGRVIACWRGDNIMTTASTIVEKYIEMKKELKIKTLNQFYDWSNKDFHTIASSMNEYFEKAEKGHEIGEDVINTLFHNDMLLIYDDPENAKLAGELSTLLRATLKRRSDDNLCDALRYCVTKIPWDFSGITGQKSSLLLAEPEHLNDRERQIFERRKAFDDEDKRLEQSLSDEFSEWNDAYGE